VAEAMACGLPAITSVCAGVADYIDDGIDGFVLREPHDAQTLSNLMERLQSQPDLRRVVGEAASKTIQEWDWNRNAARIWELLKNAKARSSPSD
jgi:UDP-glucose:(heptosyl)LPS alpha-1,3-glucosyltransferase